MGTWEFLSHRVDAWMARCPLCVIPVRKDGGRDQWIKREEGGWGCKRGTQTVSDSLQDDLFTPVARQRGGNLSLAFGPVQTEEEGQTVENICLD